MNLFELIRSDYRKYHRYGGNFFGIVFLTQGFWAVFQYRFANWAYSRITLQPFRFLAMIWMLLWQKAVEITTGIAIPASAKIGHSFYIGHFGGIIINSEAVIGDNCNISQGVTIGKSGRFEKKGVPVIGNNVYIGVNSVVAGKITVGDDVLIGACSMVNTSLADFSVAIGVPAMVVSQHGSKEYI